MSERDCPFKRAVPHFRASGVRLQIIHEGNFALSEAGKVGLQGTVIVVLNEGN